MPTPIESLTQVAAPNLDAAITHLDAALAACEVENASTDTDDMLLTALQAIAITHDGDPANSDHLSPAELIFAVLSLYRRDLRELITLRQATQPDGTLKRPDPTRALAASLATQIAASHYGSGGTTNVDFVSGVATQIHTFLEAGS